MKKCTKTLVLLGLIFSLALVLSVGSAVAKEETIKLGIIYAMTGNVSACWGTQTDVCREACSGEEINQAGGANFGDKKVMIEAIVPGHRDKTRRRNPVK